MLRWWRNWAAQRHLARAVGKRSWGCRAKRLFVSFVLPLTPHFTQQQKPKDKDDQNDHFFLNHPERAGYFAA